MSVHDSKHINSSNQPPFVLAEVSERCMADPAIILLSLDKFEQQMRAQLPEIERTVAAGDAKQVAFSAHSLKGAAGMMAAESIRGLAAQLEDMARAADLASADACLSQLRQEVDRCTAYLATVRAQLSGQAQPAREIGGQR